MTLSELIASLTNVRTAFEEQGVSGRDVSAETPDGLPIVFVYSNHTGLSVHLSDESPSVIGSQQ